MPPGSLLLLPDMIRMKNGFLLTILAFLLLPAADMFGANEKDSSMTDIAKSHNIPYGSIDPSFISVAYSGGEFFRYDISYTGGFKLGELHLALRKNSEEEERACLVGMLPWHTV